jgi:hypothetical protein
MLTTLPGALGAKPGSAGFPMFGIQPVILRPDGSKADVNEGGSLCVTAPWPGMLRGVYGDPVNERIRHTYFAKFPGIYFSGDGCRQDPDGYYWLLGRMDDVINVSAHRFATAEFESSLVGDSRVVRPLWRSSSCAATPRTRALPRSRPCVITSPRRSGRSPSRIEFISPPRFPKPVRGKLCAGFFGKSPKAIWMASAIPAPWPIPVWWTPCWNPAKNKKFVLPVLTCGLWLFNVPLQWLLSLYPT